MSVNKLLLILVFGLWAPLCAERAVIVQRPSLASLEHTASCMIAEKKWEVAAGALQKIIRFYGSSQQVTRSYYLLGICLYNLRDFDLANKAFSCFLEKDVAGAHFEEVICYKFEIAEAFRRGECSHLFGARQLPKWMSSDNEAIEIYDEIIAVMPGQELAVRSLWGKGMLLVRTCRYKEGREAFQTLITAFPKHPLAIESYLQIACSYLKECQKESNNSDLLSLAAINIKKFQQAFPGEPRIAVAEKMYRQMQECFAASIYDIAEFYERTCHPHAAVICYKSILRDFPTTSYARCSLAALDRLESCCKCS